MRITNLHLAGSTYCEGQELIHREMKKGHTLLVENLYLVRDSYNPVDANAVQVWYDDNGEKVRLGYVQRDQAPEVAECMDDGGSVCAIGVTICGTEDANYGMYFRVQMTYPCDFAALDSDSHPDDSSYDNSLIHPQGYEFLEGDDDSEPPYFDEPDIPDDCEWDVSFLR